MLENFKDKKILVLGFGREGKDTFLFLRKLFPQKIIGISDRNLAIAQNLSKQKNIRLYLGENYLDALKDYDVVIKSPGIPAKILPSQKLRRAGQIITSQTEIFFDNCKGTIVGVTGTKGKSTTASLIHDILKNGGVKTRLIGNIGKPVLNYLFSVKPNDIYIYELSSHQLRGLKKSPHIAVFLNIFSEHLDYYKNFQEYAEAKANITLHQKKQDYLIFNASDKIIAQFAIKSKAQKLPIGGQYHELDKNAARRAGEIFNIPKATVEKTIKNFKPLPHRLELAGTFKGITFYNDALSTIPETAIFAMKALGKNVQTVFLGGYDRNINFVKLAEYLAESKNIKNLILFPTTGKKIWDSVLLAYDKLYRGRAPVKLPRRFFVDNMRDAVIIAYQNTNTGKIALLSCASTSFSLFRDYKEKGNLFKKFVKKLGKK